MSAAGRSPPHESQASNAESPELTSLREYNHILGLVVAIAAQFTVIVTQNIHSVNYERVIKWLFYFSEARVQELRETLAFEVPTLAAHERTTWAKRQIIMDSRLKSARPLLFQSRLAAQSVVKQQCHRCHQKAVIRCLDCVPSDMEFLCGKCDVDAHKRNIFHDREALINDFLEPVPPTTAVCMDENGKPHFCEQGTFIFNNHVCWYTCIQCIL